jgi:glycerol-1-phosphate dehydrogenase [NAD(P)+]
MVGKELRDNKISVDFLESDGELKDALDSLVELVNPLIITDQGFAGEYLDSLELEAHIFRISREDLRNVEEAKKNLIDKKCKAVVGFGGGRSLDIAKKLAYDENLELILVPTAPSHDGIISRTSSLYDDGVKKSFLCKYASKIIVPLHLWSFASRHKKAGMLDVFSNIISLQDVFLAHRMIGEEIKSREFKLASAAVSLMVRSSSLRELAMALFSSALAMRDGSRYCSGSEHELEKTLAPHFPQYMHGELVGLSSLICAQIYNTHNTLPNDLLFPQESMLDELLQLYRKKDTLSPIKQFFNDTEFMKNASTIRPERYTLWNVVDSREIDFDAVLDEIRTKL